MAFEALRVVVLMYSNGRDTGSARCEQSMGPNCLVLNMHSLFPGRVLVLVRECSGLKHVLKVVATVPL